MSAENTPDPPEAVRPASGVSLLERREIEAGIAARLIRAFGDALGRRRSIEIAAEAVRADAMAGGKRAAEALGGNSLADLARFVRETWAQGDALTVDFVEETGDVLRFNVTRCRYAEMYERLGLMDLGPCLSCARDEAFAHGLNPRLRLDRAGTLMDGAPLCDFRFVLAEAGD